MVVGNVERAEDDALAATGDEDVLSAADMRLELDCFIATQLPDCGIDLLEHLSESGPPATAQQQREHSDIGLRH